MPDDTKPAAQPDRTDQGKPGFWDRCDRILTGINNQFHFFVSLPVVTVVGSLLASHFQYVAAYQDKVKEIGEQQMKAAESTFTDVATSFATAITLQQLLFFNFHDAINANSQGDEKALETKTARALYLKYDELHTNLVESIDLLARRVEMNLDWASDPNHDAAKHAGITSDQLSRIALGAYNFNCDSRENTPFNDDKQHTYLKARDDAGHIKPDLPALDIDWYSAKHELLTLYYCFQVDHRRLKLPLKWAAASTLDPAASDSAKSMIHDALDSLDQEAVRLHFFLALGAQRIEDIRVKFRPRVWYCQVPLVRQIVDAYSRKCTPIRFGGS